MTQANILVVDDTPQNVKLLADLLALKGYRVCTAANVIGKVTCFAARFTPWAMIGCVPATGISLACLAYNVYQLTGGGQPDPLPPPNPCTCGCPCNHGD